ncbi:MAG: class I SAM-dependent methyltransferase [Nitrospinota bacterium]|nr:class I SAM-dependent methyltransferase [Nitrospinota bacterium]MDH5679542.1 class I SAM-dependent methyltransferase [Nitrospinota bacterium]
MSLDSLYTTQKEYYRSLYASEQPEPWDRFFDGDWLKGRLGAKGANKGKLALEIGAGKGRGASILSNAGYRCVAIDYLLAPMTQAPPPSGANSPCFVNADLFAAPFVDGVFNLALDWGVFHHIRRKETGLYIRAVRRLLGPDGRLLLGCFSTRFRHPGEGRRKRGFTLHHGHYDRFSTRTELKKTFGPWFIITSMEERKEGYYLLDMTAREK